LIGRDPGVDDAGESYQTGAHTSTGSPRTIRGGLEQRQSLGP
jgi:hypothetical protein